MGRDIYMGSSFSLKDRVQRTYDALTEEGHTVLDVWWDESKEQADLKTLDVPDSEWYEHPTVVERAKRHWENVRNAEAFVLVCPPDGETKKFNGANLELGYAFAHVEDTYALGRLERSAMYVGPDGDPVTQVQSVEELLAEVGEGPC